MNNKFHGLLFQVYDQTTISSIDQAGKFHRRRAGGHRIANFLRSNDWDVEVIDFAALFLLDELKELVKSRINSNTKFFGFSCIFQSWPDTINLLTQWLKKTYPHVLIIWGGGYLPPTQVASIDYFITGYGENALYQLLKVITGNSPASSISYDLKYGGKKVISADKSCPSFPLRHLSIKFEKRDFLLADEWGHIELSRGCIFKCKFCSYPVLGVKGDYTQDADDFANCIQYNHDNYGIKNYYVVDETFNDSTEKIQKYADKVEKLSFTPFFSGFIRADLLINRPEDRHQLLRMNFLGHYYGIESLNYASAKSIGKGTNSEKIKEGLVDIKKFFLANNRKIYRGSMSMIVGLPYETLNSLKSSLNWINSHWNDQHHVWTALVLPSNESVAQGFGDNQSFLSSNYDKFGYVSQGIKQVNGANWIDWKNDSFTWEAAESYARKYIPKFYPCNNVGNLTLDDLIFAGRSIDDALLTPSTPDDLLQAYQYKLKIVEQYRHKKLSI